MPVPLRARPLRQDDPAALALVVDAGLHGAYIRNALAEGHGEGRVFADDDRDVALTWLGPRGNLVVIADTKANHDLEEVRSWLERRARSWRLAMGPRAVLDVVASRLPVRPLVLRDQHYYGGDRRGAATLTSDEPPRPAEWDDRAALAKATLALNEADLRIDPRRVDRRWLHETIEQRIHDGTTRVIGPVGAPWCKLDLGSDGPGGLVIEGVFTFPEHRGRGLGSALVASCLREASAQVLLHVAANNRAARRAYERAGMCAAGVCRLLLPD